MSAPALSQLDRARFANRNSWRSATIACLVLLITGIGVFVIPFVLIATIVGNGRREAAAIAGTYDDAPRSIVDEKALQRWIMSVALAGLAVALAVVGNGNALIVSVLLAIGAVALRPWQHSLRPEEPVST